MSKSMYQIGMARGLAYRTDAKGRMAKCPGCGKEFHMDDAEEGGAAGGGAPDQPSAGGGSAGSGESAGSGQGA